MRKVLEQNVSITGLDCSFIQLEKKVVTLETEKRLLKQTVDDVVTKYGE